MKAIDLFAGLGGFTEGAEQAGAEVLWAGNHWPLAVANHSRNHAGVEHVCQDLHQANWARVPSCDIVMASPCCQGHSQARGKNRPQHDASRSTAWAVVSCCEYHRPDYFVVENVPEFRNWTLYRPWQLAMQALGYQMTENLIDAADCGVPQNRNRLFIVGSRKGALTISKPAAEHKPIGPTIDWDWPRWSRIKDKTKRTRDRARNGRAAFGDRFVMPYNGSGSGLTGRCLSRPLGTVTAADRWSVVSGTRMRMMQPPEYREAMGFRGDYELSGNRRQQIQMLGNAVCPPVAAHVVKEILAAG